MASPAVVGTPAETAISTASTSHTVNLPTGTAGNMFVAIMSKGSAGTTPTVNALTGWEELLDEAQTLGLFIAVKECDGTEGATTTFTLSSSTRGAWIVYEVSGQVAFATQAPQVGTTATGSSTTPDPPSVSVTGGAKDILTIACFGRAGEEADDDTWVTQAPSGFGGLLQKACGTAGTNLAGMVATAHLAETTATADPGTFTAATGAWRAQTVVIHPVPPTSTAVAEVGLESGGAPAVDTGHSIKIRARTTAGAGTMRAALYEGANNRSGDLESSALTTSLADYTLSISEANAANITDYSDLSIRFWGYAAGGGAIVFEVDQLWLEIPESGAVQGAVAAPFTFQRVVAAILNAKAAVAFPVTFQRVVTARVTARSQVATTETFGVTTSGFSTRRSAVDLPITFTAVTDATSAKETATDLPVTFQATTSGTVTARSAVDLPVTFDAVTDTQATVRAAASMAVTFDATTTGRRTTFGATVLPEQWNVTTDGNTSTNIQGAAAMELEWVSRTGAPRVAAAGLVFLFGDAEPQSGVLTARTAVAFPVTFGFTTDSEGVVTGSASSTWTFGVTTAQRVTERAQVAFPVTFGVVTNGEVTGVVTGSSASTWTFTATTNTHVTRMGQVAFPVTFTVVTAPRATLRSRVDLPITFGITTSGTQAGFHQGAASLSITANITTAGLATHYGATSLPVTFGATTAGRATVRAATATTLTFGVTSSGFATRQGRTSLPILFDIETRGVGEGFKAGRLSLEITDTIQVAARLTARSTVSLPVAFTVTTSPRQVAFAQVDMPWVFNIKSGNPIYSPGVTGYISFGRPGTIGKPNAGRVRLGSVQ